MRAHVANAFRCAAAFEARGCYCCCKCCCGGWVNCHLLLYQFGTWHQRQEEALQFLLPCYLMLLYSTILTYRSTFCSIQRMCTTVHTTVVERGLWKASTYGTVVSTYTSTSFQKSLAGRQQCAKYSGTVNQIYSTVRMSLKSSGTDCV